MNMRSNSLPNLAILLAAGLLVLTTTSAALADKSLPPTPGRPILNFNKINERSTTSLPIKWNGHGESFFEIRYQQSSPGFGHPARILRDVQGSGTLLGDLTPGRSYSISVRAKNASGVSSFGPARTIRTFLPPQLSSLELDRPRVTGGSTVEVSVALRDPYGIVVSLSSSNPQLAPVPSTVTIARGAGGKATFTIRTTVPTRRQQATITASLSDGRTKTVTLTVDPRTPKVSRIRFTSQTVLGGYNARLTVQLNQPPTTSLGVELRSDRNVLQVPTKVLFEKGQTIKVINLRTSPTTSKITATVTAILDDSSKTARVYIQPIPKGLARMKLEKTSISGGFSTSVTVTLAGPAPAGGLNVNLRSSSSTLAQVPKTINFKAGQKSVTLKIATRKVFKTTKVKLTASVGGDTRQAVLTLTARTSDKKAGRTTNIAAGNKSRVARAKKTAVFTRPRR